MLILFIQSIRCMHGVMRSIRAISIQRCGILIKIYVIMSFNQQLFWRVFKSHCLQFQNYCHINLVLWFHKCLALRLPIAYIYYLLSHREQDLEYLITSDIVVIMSTFVKCPLCKKNSHEPINLKCEHHPCYSCIKNYVAIQTQSKLQTKYKIHCPACSKKTVFYDIRHLIVTKNQQNDEQLFVTDQYLTQKPEMKVQEYAKKVQSTSLSNEVSVQHFSRRGSINSIANNNKVSLQIKCVEHNEPFKYFCNDCGEGRGRGCLLCAQCAKPHYNGGHKLLILRQSESKLYNINMKNKQQLQTKAFQWSKTIQNLTESKASLNEYYSGLAQTINLQFKKIYTTLQNRHNQIRNELKVKFDQNLTEITAKVDSMRSELNILESLKEIQLKDFQTSLKFYQTFQKFIISNESKFSSIRGKIEQIRLPKVQTNLQKIQFIAKDLVTLNNIYDQTIKNRSRKNSLYDDTNTYRSQRQKQNRSLQISQEEFRLNPRKLVS